jgi:hypothetical protein
MVERTYPRMAYHADWPRVDGQVIRYIGQDTALSAGWDDPYGVRSAVVTADPACPETVTEAPEATPPARKKPGRPRKVKE